jgi:hypothetical protein
MPHIPDWIWEDHCSHLPTYRNNHDIQAKKCAYRREVGSSERAFRPTFGHYDRLLRQIPHHRFGALVAAPLSLFLMDFFRTSTSPGVAETFVTLGTVYLVCMLFGVWRIRIPPEGWRTKGSSAATLPVSAHAGLNANEAIRTPQFYLLFAVLILNVTAGIGVLGQASVMIQEMFSENTVGAQRGIGAAAAALPLSRRICAICSAFGRSGPYTGVCCWPGARRPFWGHN